MKNKAPIIIGLLSIVGIAAFYLIRQYQLLMAYTYKFSNFNVQKISGSTATVTTTLTVSNPSNVDVNIDGYNLNIFLNGNQVTNLTSNNRVLVKANNSSDIPLVISFDYSNVFKQVLSLSFLSSFLNGSANMQLTGTISLSINGVAIKNLNVDYTEPINLGSASPNT